MKAMKFSGVSGRRQAKKPYSPLQAARKALLRKTQRLELRRLQTMLPGSARSRLSAAGKEEDPCAVISSVMDYIDALHSTIIARVRQGTLSPEVLTRLRLNETMGQETSISMSHPHPRPAQLPPSKGSV